MNKLAALTALCLITSAVSAQEADVAIIELKPNATNAFGYDKTDLTVKAGQKVKLTMNNTGSIVPQPREMLPDWERIFLASLDVPKGDELKGTLLYHNIKTNAIQASDPRPPPVPKEPLPAGWRRAFDDEGDVYYIDMNGDMNTYDNPMIISVWRNSRMTSLTLDVTHL